MRAEYKFFVCMVKTTEFTYRANEYKEVKKVQRHEGRTEKRQVSAAIIAITVIYDQKHAGDANSGDTITLT